LPYVAVNERPVELQHVGQVAGQRSRLDLVLYHIPQFANPIEVTTLVELCQHPRIVGVKDSARDLPRFLNTMAKIRPLRPDFACLIGCEEILVPALLMGADGGTVASSGVVPETLMAAYHAAKGGDWPTAVRIQYQMLELIETMLRGGDFPEGFRAGMVARGFDMGPGKIDLSPSQPARPELTQQIQCLIAEHGHTAPPAAGCPAPGHPAHGWPAHPNWQHANGVHEQFDPDLIRHLVEQVTQRLAGEHHPALTHANPTP